MAETELTLESIVGKTMLAGVSYRTSDGDLSDRQQIFGTISAADSEGITVTMENGDEFVFPPDLSAIEKAEPGVYTLNASGAAVENPDLLSVWTVYEG